MTSDSEARLIELAELNDGLTPDIVVDDASRPDSPLHRHFCWDDTKAAHEFRLEQARRLIRRFDIVIERSSGDPVQVRSFQFIPSVDKYMPVERVMRDRQMRDELIARAAAELRSFRLKYQKLLDVDLLVRQVFELDPVA